MNCQMILVISSPSSSTTVPSTLIFAMGANLRRDRRWRRGAGFKLSNPRPDQRARVVTSRPSHRVLGSLGSTRTSQLPELSRMTASTPSGRHQGELELGLAVVADGDPPVAVVHGDVGAGGEAEHVDVEVPRLILIE